MVYRMIFTYPCLRRASPVGLWRGEVRSGCLVFLSYRLRRGRCADAGGHPYGRAHRAAIDDADRPFAMKRSASRVVVVDITVPSRDVAVGVPSPERCYGLEESLSGVLVSQCFADRCTNRASGLRPRRSRPTRGPFCSECSGVDRGPREHLA